jgi:RNA polymerase sigma-70 factor (ECF subfamily)
VWLLWAVIDGPALPGPLDPRGVSADQEALRRVGAGDADALAVLYDRYSRPVYSLALRIVSDPAEAEDVVQDVFAQVWRQAGRYDVRRGPVVAWLMTITRTRAIDRLRSRRARPDGTPADYDRQVERMADTREAQEELAIAAEHVARLRAALPELPVVQRLAIEMAFFEGLSHNEIAERLEQPLGTIKTRIRLGLLKLRDAMGAQ